MSLPFATVFHPAYNRFYHKNGVPPTHLLIGPKELQLFDDEGRANYFLVQDPTCTKRIYGGVEILVTYDTESIMHFFIQ